MLGIRNREIRIFAEAVMNNRGVPSLTAVLKLALQNEVRLAEEAIPLRERITAIRAKALAKSDRTPLPPLTEDERYNLWDR